jgi:hypothetical protein
MRATIAAVLAVAGSMSMAAFAADKENQVDDRRPICHPKSGSSRFDDSRAIECRQPQPVSVVAEHALAQTGLAIGLASTVLQSQIAILEAVVEQSSSCVALTGGGSVLSNGNGTAVTIYYGPDCNQPYIVATPNTTSTDSSFVIAETAVYYGLSGTEIGTMTLNETATFNQDGSVNLYGLGIFTPLSGARTPVQLGLYCAIASATSAQCGGGIAQNFPALELAIGAVTPLNLSLNLSDSTAPVTFTGGGSALSGATGSLTLTNPSPTSLVIKGGTAFATTTSSGGAAEFSLFPPTPTAWTLADPAHDQVFSISVASNTARNLTMKITQPGRGGTLAIGAIDQSGSGTITYSDGSTATITNWTLSD